MSNYRFIPKYREILNVVGSKYDYYLIVDIFYTIFNYSLRCFNNLHQKYILLKNVTRIGT